MGCRQLLVSGSLEQLRAVHSALQSGLMEAQSSAEALPSLECALLCLEAAGGGRSPKGFASQVSPATLYNPIMSHRRCPPVFLRSIWEGDLGVCGWVSDREYCHH